VVEEKKWANNVLTKKLDLDNHSTLSQEKKFDCVLMIALLEHLENPEGLLKEIKKILKKNGTVIITTPTPLAKPILELLSFKLKLISETAIREHKHYFSKREIVSLLKKLGFSEVNHRFFEIGFNQIVIAKNTDSGIKS
jgi:2-polyprenyl-3-methyl-5-hydroxy-6-metoxy-1,4-benzoquinol methylase